MYNKILEVTLVALMAYKATATDLNGDDYEANKAEDKFYMIKEMIESEEMEVAEIQYENLGRFFTQRMTFSLIFEGDDMPGDALHQTRIKHGHMQGLVAPIRWHPEADNPYSGLF